MSVNRRISTATLLKPEDVEANYQSADVLSISNLMAQGIKYFITGLLFHVSQPVPGDQKIKYEVTIGMTKKASNMLTFYRMAFFKTLDNEICAVFYTKERDFAFRQSQYQIGQIYKLITPDYFGRWRGNIHLLETHRQPHVHNVSWPISTMDFIFGIEGYKVYKLENLIINVNTLWKATTCSGRLCGGIYGMTCPCTCRSEMLIEPALGINISFRNISEELQAVKFVDHYIKPASIFFGTDNDLEGTNAQISAKLMRYEDLLHGSSATVTMWIKGTKLDESEDIVIQRGHIIKLENVDNALSPDSLVNIYLKAPVIPAITQPQSLAVPQPVPPLTVTFISTSKKKKVPTATLR